MRTYLKEFRAYQELDDSNNEKRCLLKTPREKSRGEVYPLVNFLFRCLLKKDRFVKGFDKKDRLKKEVRLVRIINRSNILA